MAVEYTCSCDNLSETTLFQVTCLNANYTDSGLFGFVAAAHPENMDKVCD